MLGRTPGAIQVIRPMRDEVERYGHYSLAAESKYDHPFQWGSKRTGPDLARVGGRYSDAWHVDHFSDPQSVVPESVMPKYAFHRRNPHELVAQATGFRAEWVQLTDAEQAWELIVESVNGKRPVAGWHGELMLLAGFEDAESRDGRRIFAMKDGNGYFAEWWTWKQFADWCEGERVSRFSERAEPLPERDVALRVIEAIRKRLRIPQVYLWHFPSSKCRVNQKLVLVLDPYQ